MNAMLLDAWEGFHVMEVCWRKYLFSFGKNNLINETPRLMALKILEEWQSGPFLRSIFMVAHHFYGGHFYGTISMVCSYLMHTRGKHPGLWRLDRF
jgi:hypothetical protein